MTIQERVRHLKQFNEDNLTEGVLRVINQPHNEAFAIDLNTLQLLSGLNSKGEPLGYYRNEAYGALKARMNPKAEGRVDLYLEGNFQGAFYLEAETFPFTFMSSDWKTGKLSNGYDFIFGHSPKNKNIYARHTSPQIVEWYKREVFRV